MRKLLPLLLLLAGIASAQLSTTIKPESTRYDYDFYVTDSTSTQIHVYDLTPNTFLSYGNYANQCAGLSRQHTQVGPNPTSLNPNPGTTVEDVYSCSASGWTLKIDGLLYYYKGGGGRACGGCGVYIQVQSGTFTEQ